jgi:hypothetical protein
MNTELTFKQCTKCRRDFPATPEYFARDAQRRDGLHPHCKACVRDWQQSRQAHLDEYRRQYCRKNKQQVKSYYRQWKARRAVNKHVAPLVLRDAGHLASVIRRMVYGDALTSGMWRLERQCMQQISDADSGKLVTGSYAEYMLYRVGNLYAVLEVRTDDTDYLQDLMLRLADDLIRRGWRLDDTRYWQGGAQTHPEMKVERVKRLLKSPPRKSDKRYKTVQS